VPAGVTGQVQVALRADDVDFIPAKAGDCAGNGVIDERFFLGAFNLYRLRLDSGQRLHAFKGHTEIHPVGSRVQVFVNAGHPLKVFPAGNGAGERYTDDTDGEEVRELGN